MKTSNKTLLETAREEYLRQYEQAAPSRQAFGVTAPKFQDVAGQVINRQVFGFDLAVRDKGRYV